jgi:4-alpha-glucanotransferase
LISGGYSWKQNLLDRAYARFSQRPKRSLINEFAAFREAQKDWLDDFALFMALKEANGGKPWVQWAPPLRDRKAQALEAARQKYDGAIQRQAFRQFLFFRQWQALHKQARKLGLQIIGDVPIFVAHDSADVWANRELFFLDRRPSYSDFGAADGFRPPAMQPVDNWRRSPGGWLSLVVRRPRATLEMVDIIRRSSVRRLAGMPTAQPPERRGEPHTFQALRVPPDCRPPPKTWGNHARWWHL